MYSILDIESSGGKYAEEKIIEIAIYKYDGTQLLDSFSTLINPETPIDPFVQKLTGITNKMVKRAPKFQEVAKRIVQITENTTLVAHNVPFDYRMLKQEFKQLGYTYNRKSLDTLLLSKHLIPNQISYSLGKLCKSLGIVVTERHRAFGDAKANLELFKILLEKDAGKRIIEKAITNKIYGKFSPLIIEMLEELPHKTGVFYFHNSNGKIIYIKSANDIAQVALRYFTSDKPLALKIQQKTLKISYHITGSMLIATIKAEQEKEINKPKLNGVRAYKNKSNNTYPEKNMLFYDIGKNTSEKSFFVIENNFLMSYGYFSLHSQIDTQKKIKARSVKVNETPFIKTKVLGFLDKKNPSKISS